MSCGNNKGNFFGSTRPGFRSASATPTLHFTPGGYQPCCTYHLNLRKGILFDQTIKLNGYYVSQYYPNKLRLIKYKDTETDKVLIFLTNNFKLNPVEIAKLYRARWFIEIFFRWVKQHLKIKSFWGQSENAVKTQVWIAVSVYALVAIAKKQFKLRQSLYEILQVLSISIFDKTPINQLFQESQSQYFKDLNDNQLTLFDL